MKDHINEITIRWERVKKFSKLREIIRDWEEINNIQMIMCLDYIGNYTEVIRWLKYQIIITIISFSN